MKRNKLFYAAMLLAFASATACGEKKGDGGNFKGYINDREPIIEETTLYDDLDGKEPIDMDSTTSNSTVGTTVVLEEEVTEATSEETTEAITEPTTTIEIIGADMTDIELTGVRLSDDSILNVDGYEVFKNNTPRGYSISFNISTKDGSECSFSVKKASINTQSVQFKETFDSGVMTVHFIFEDTANYGDVCAMFDITVSAEVSNEGIDNVVSEDIRFTAVLKQ